MDRRKQPSAAASGAGSRSLRIERLESRQMLSAISPVSDTLQSPFRRAVQLYAVWDTNGNGDPDDARYTNSGAMISERHVLTAAHSVYNDARGGHADWVFVHAARNSESFRPFGEARGTQWSIPGAYSDDSAVNDLAVVALDRSLGDHTGWFGVASFGSQVANLGFGNGLFSETLDIFQYPAQHSFAGSPLVGEEQYTSSLHYSQNVNRHSVFPGWDEPPVLTVSHDVAWTTRGSSGSPLVVRDTGQIIGVLSGGDTTPIGAGGSDTWTLINDSPQWGQTTIGWVSDRLDELTPSLRDRPVLTDHDQWFDESTSSVSNATPSSGDPVDVRARIFNGGTAGAEDVRVRFRLSSDERYDTTDTFLGDAFIASLPAFATRTATLSVDLPALDLGLQHVVWTTDPLNEINENTPLLHNTHATHRTNHRNGAVAVTARDDRHEPNDTRAAAHELTENSNLSGVQYDDDWYAIEVVGDDRLVTATLQFVHDHGDIDIAIYDSSGNRIESSVSFSDDEVLKTVVPSAGLYYLKVYGPDRGNEYLLHWYGSQLPDLVPQTLDLRVDEAFAGDSVSATFAVRNEGAGDAEDAEVKFYLSRDATITTDDALVGSRTLDIDAGRTLETALTLKLPSGAHPIWDGNGAYYIGMIVDADNDIVESDESNNQFNYAGLDQRSIDVTVFEPGYREYVIASVDSIDIPAFDPALGQLEAVTVFATVASVVQTDARSDHHWAAPHVVEIPVGPMRLFGATLPPISQLSPHFHGVLIQGGSRAFTTPEELSQFSTANSWPFPSSIMTTDGLHSLPSSGYQVFTTTQFTYAPPPADLSPVEMIVPGGTFYGSDELDFAYRLENLGVGPADTFDIQFYLSRDTTIDPESDHLLSETEAPAGLLAGALREEVLSARLPHPSNAFWDGDGVYYLGMVIDQGDEIVESDESNNVSTRVGVDIVPIPISVNRPGEFAVIGSGDLSGVILPGFDPSLGNLTSVEVTLTLGSSITDFGWQFSPLIPHYHGVEFNVGGISLHALALPDYTGQTNQHFHLVNQAALAKGKITDPAELAGFAGDTATLDVETPVTTSTDVDHSHTIQHATFIADVVYHYSAPLDPGDFDGDGLVGAGDRDLWIETFGSTTDLRGDANGNDRVDGGDFLAWQRGFGTSQLQASAVDGDANADRDVDSADLTIWGFDDGGAAVAVSVVATTDQSSRAFAESTSESPVFLNLVARSTSEFSGLAPNRADNGRELSQDLWERHARTHSPPAPEQRISASSHRCDANLVDHVFARSDDLRWATAADMVDTRLSSAGWRLLD